jgi:hypothetical protein
MNPVWIGLLVILALQIWWTISKNVSVSFRGYGSIGNLKSKSKIKASTSSRKQVPKGAKATTLAAALSWLEKNQSAAKHISTLDQKRALEVHPSTDGYRVLLISADPQPGIENRVSRFLMDQNSENTDAIRRIANGNFEINVAKLSDAADLANMVATKEWGLSEMDTVRRWSEPQY